MEKEHNIAVFPVPEMVAFPGMVIPLHIFEPRYRQMFQEAQDLHMPISLALPKKKISEVSTEGMSQEDVLSRNMSSYEAHRVVCGGRPRLLETLPDGRMMVQVICSEIYTIKEITQVLPYYKASCILEKAIWPERNTTREQLKNLVEISSTLLKHKVELDHETLDENHIQYTFKYFVNWILQWLPLTPEFKQRLLENFDTSERYEILFKEMSAWIPKVHADRQNGDVERPLYRKEDNIIRVDFGQHDHNDIQP